MLETIELKDDLIKMIRTKEIKIAVLGLGYFGLPNAALFASVRF
jgi:UDP-N-acetyl-D-mannosaminuronate dehydrogenase